MSKTRKPDLGNVERIEVESAKGSYWVVFYAPEDEIAGRNGPYHSQLLAEEVANANRDHYGLPLRVSEAR